jgi:uncharacterized protein (DUF3084 family)
VNELAAQIVALQVIDQEIDLVEDEISQVQTELDQRIEALAEREQHIDYLTTTIDELEKSAVPWMMKWWTRSPMSRNVRPR